MNPLSDNNIFKIPLDSRYSRPDLCLIYAPLSGNMLIASESDCIKLSAIIENKTPGDESSREVLEALLSGIPASQREGKVNHVNDFLYLYILPNYICNFSCSYCFSAKGRGRGEIKESDLKATLDFFIDSERTASKKLAISYLGGGEPTLSWPLLRFALEYSQVLADKNGIELFNTVVTNGSRITPEIVDCFNKYNVLPRVSFEILEDIQSQQRSEYAGVCHGLELLGNCNRPAMVRSMITPINVGRMTEMIQILHERFPKVKEVLFDPISSAETFHEPEFTKSFYDTYFTEFLSARALALEYGINLSCAPIRNLDYVVERYCTGELCLTPEGSITICHQISSPKEDGYADSLYGRVENGKLVLNDNKFRELASKYTIYTRPECSSCWLKWNCGGGCMMQNKRYTQEVFSTICDFTRRFSLHFLMERLNESFSENGECLDSYIASYGK